MSEILDTKTNEELALLRKRNAYLEVDNRTLRDENQLLSRRLFKHEPMRRDMVLLREQPPEETL